MNQSAKGRGTSEARSRLLDTATRIFYAEGIHSVGVDRIVAEAQVTRATLYRHFTGKEDLVLAYLERVDRDLRAQAEAAQAGEQAPADKIRAVCRTISAGIQSPGFRGCAFLNAAAEYPDADHPVHRAVLSHRQWFQDTITGLLAETGDPAAEPAGRHLVMLRDGAMTSGCLADPALVSETFLRGVEGLLRALSA
ncbi:TetR/AcrR family transcriptional regulator [Streptomyces sp. NBC_00102]|uniref:TetR/AcrR family transcriptional regulator n=1 Tax=Streptomyces sp. NBC_00102 TaxID=2975652 RepID=UPI00224D3FAD|nr:TetR/AcrR family transcriptional regulator [Streptomyces sp. NBC_00102]MCX5400448.1 TetR/AcrR family transcriptional regulator [Streptomyces sp. NBC_00102]